MGAANLHREMLEELRAVLQREARRNRGKLALSPEVAARLEAFATSAPADAEASPEAAAPAAAAHEDRAAALETLAKAVSGCTRCALHEGRTQTVFGVGSPTADLVFVGEAPGEQEDRQGEPFVGRAGQLLTDIIEKGMKLRREDVYICNTVKCRPPGNRDPRPEEKQCCEPYLLRQLDLLKPKVICALGKHAAQTLLKSDESTGKMRGKWHSYHGIPLRVTWHPAYLLRNPAEKRGAWADVQEVMKVLNGEVRPEV